MAASNLRAFINTLPKQIARIQKFPVTDASGAFVGWHCNALSQNDEILGSGTAVGFEDAKRVAIAEFLERSLVKEIGKDEDLRKMFWLTEDPSTSGFAAGFERQSTRFRAFAEALERWAWSKWIDGSKYIPMVDNVRLSGLAKGLATHFDSIELRQIRLQSDNVQFDGDIQFSVFLGFCGSGVFPGSRVTANHDDPWTHGAVEAWRNLINYKGVKASVCLPNTSTGNEWVLDRVVYFGDHSAEARQQILCQPRGNWPAAKVKGPREYETGHPSIFLWRALCEDYVPWQIGKVNRFVY